MHDVVVFGTKHRTGELLVKAGKIQQGQLDRALSHQGTVPHRLGDILLTLGFLNEEDLLEVLSGQLGLAIYKEETDDEFLPLNISKLFHREHPFVLVKRADGKHILKNDGSGLDLRFELW